VLGRGCGDFLGFVPNRAVRGGSLQRGALKADGAARQSRCRAARERRAADSLFLTLTLESNSAGGVSPIT
jgi:hypothetical protein